MFIFTVTYSSNTSEFESNVPSHRLMTQVKVTFSRILSLSPQRLRSLLVV